VCVRYRYDAENKKRYKTVELIVDRRTGKSRESAYYVSIWDAIDRDFHLGR
jgi:hypothetical protein